MGKKDHNIVYGAAKSSETQFLISMLDTRTSHEVTKISLLDKVVRLRKVVFLKHIFVCNSNSFQAGVFVNMLQVQ